MTTESSKRNGTVQKSAQRAIATPRAGPFALGRNESSATKLGAAEDGHLAPLPSTEAEIMSWKAALVVRRCSGGALRERACRASQGRGGGECVQTGERGFVQIYNTINIIFYNFKIDRKYTKTK